MTHRKKPMLRTWKKRQKQPSPETLEEFKAIICIAPMSANWTIKICTAIEKFQRRYPQTYNKIMEETTVDV